MSETTTTPAKKKSPAPILIGVIALAVLGALFFFVIRPLVFGSDEVIAPVTPGAAAGTPSPSASPTESPLPVFPTHAERDPFAPVPGLPVR